MNNVLNFKTLTVRGCLKKGKEQIFYILLHIKVFVLLPTCIVENVREENCYHFFSLSPCVQLLRAFLNNRLTRVQCYCVLFPTKPWLSSDGLEHKITQCHGRIENI